MRSFHERPVEKNTAYQRTSPLVKAEAMPMLEVLYAEKVEPTNTLHQSSSLQNNGTHPASEKDLFFDFVEPVAPEIAIAIPIKDDIAIAEPVTSISTEKGINNIYDQKGRVIEETYLIENGMIEKRNGTKIHDYFNEKHEKIESVFLYPDNTELHHYFQGNNKIRMTAASPGTQEVESLSKRDISTKSPVISIKKRLNSLKKITDELIEFADKSTIYKGYDTDGALSYSKVKNSDNSLIETSYQSGFMTKQKKFNQDGKKIEDFTIDDFGYKTTTRYDEDGSIISQTIIDFEGNQKVLTKKVFRDQNNIVEQMIDSDGNLSSQSKYDLNHNLIESEVHRSFPNEGDLIIINRFNKNGDTISFYIKDINQDGSFNETSLKEGDKFPNKTYFNNKGIKTSSEQETQNGTTITQYDANGNIRKVTRKSDKTLITENHKKGEATITKYLDDRINIEKYDLKTGLPINQKTKYKTESGYDQKGNPKRKFIEKANQTPQIFGRPTGIILDQNLLNSIKPGYEKSKSNALSQSSQIEEID